MSRICIVVYTRYLNWLQCSFALADTNLRSFELIIGHQIAQIWRLEDEINHKLSVLTRVKINNNWCQWHTSRAHLQPDARLSYECLKLPVSTFNLESSCHYFYFWIICLNLLLQTKWNTNICRILIFSHANDACKSIYVNCRCHNERRLLHP